MTDRNDIAVLQARIDELDGEVEKLRQELLQAQLDQWEGRIDDLEVQLHLGSMEVNERVAPLVEVLRGRWLDTKEQVAGASSTANDVIDTLRGGLEKAMKDIRNAIVDAKSTVSG